MSSRGCRRSASGPGSASTRCTRTPAPAYASAMACHCASARSFVQVVPSFSRLRSAIRAIELIGSHSRLSGRPSSTSVRIPVWLSRPTPCGSCVLVRGSMVTAMANLLGGRRDGSAAPSAGVGVCARRRAVGTESRRSRDEDANMSFSLCGSENDIRSLSGPPSGPARRDRGVAGSGRAPARRARGPHESRGSRDERRERVVFAVRQAERHATCARPFSRPRRSPGRGPRSRGRASCTSAPCP